QNACALFALSKPAVTSASTPVVLMDPPREPATVPRPNGLDGYFLRFGAGCPGSPSSGSADRTTLFSATCPRGAFARSVAACVDFPPSGGPPQVFHCGSEHDTAPVQ